MSRAEFRRSQGIVPHGVGAIVDFPDESLMTAGLDAWHVEKAQGHMGAALRRATLVVDTRLQARLSRELGRGINGLYSPPEAPEEHGSIGYAASSDAPPPRAYTPFVRFPLWHFCPRCRAMKQVAWNAPRNDKSLKCRNPHFFRDASKNTKPCSELPESRKPVLVPVRFITACINGHIEDFPWPEWAHHGHTPCGDTLFFVSGFTAVAWS